MNNVPKHVVNTIKKDNGSWKINAVAKTFATAVNKIDDPRTWEVDYGRIEERTYYAVPVAKESAMREKW